MFKGLEGLRAWLAWTVVFSHIAMSSGLSAVLPKGELLLRPGDYAVRVFIIISGFVIANLVLSKAEPYPIYIARRFLRIFPTYLVALFFSILTAETAFHAVIDYPGTIASQLQHFTIQQQQFHENFLVHIAAHLPLLHGAIPNSVLPESQYMFLAPAWSLSLEWQFYLIAPLWIGVLRRYPFAATSLTFVVALISNVFVAKHFFNPSFLPGAAMWFLLGIATRMFIPFAPRLTTYPFLAVYGSFGLAIIDQQLIVLSVWIATVAYLMQDEKWRALDSDLAQKAGARSYAVYIMHFPVLLFSLHVATKVLHLGVGGAIPAIATMTALGTLIASEIIHRWIETPAINFARTIGRERTSLAVAEG